MHVQISPMSTVSDGFYMCWTCQNVYELTKKWKVYWMNEVEGTKNRFRFEYVEWLLGDYSCVISEVKMKRIGPKLYEMTQVGIFLS